MNKIIQWVAIGLAGAALIISSVALVGDNQPVDVEALLGGSTSDSWSVGGNLTVTGTSLLTGGTTITGDQVVSGGTLNVTTSNTATSTLVVGCIEFYATSTATAHKFQASTTPGAMVSVYGSCPRL